MYRASLEFVKNNVKKPNHALGQNFFIDAERLIATLDKLELENRPVLEIGAGLGGLSELLISRCARVKAIELDAQLAEQLRGELDAEIICADALKLDTRFMDKNWFVVGNLPYYITTPLIEKYLQTPASDFLFMVQQEAGERFYATPSHKNYGVIAIISQLFFTATTLDTLPPSCYYPEPPITSVLVHLKRKGEIPKGFIPFIKTCMQMRRKTLSNNLKGYAGVSEAMAELKLDASIRAEALTGEQFLTLFGILLEKQAIL